MIKADANYILIEGLKKEMTSSLEILCVPKYDGVTHFVDCRVIDSNGAQFDGINLTFTDSDLLAFTSSGPDEIRKYTNLIEQAVIDYLEGIGANSLVNFKISYRIRPQSAVYTLTGIDTTLTYA